MTDHILNPKKNDRVLLLGNEAIVRGALEAGVQFVSQYPGTPLSDLGTTFTNLMNLKKVNGLYFQWAANEAAALQAAAGASWCGITSLVPAKHVGINVLSDSLCVIALNGPTSSYGEGGLVIIDGGDPASLGSHCEQNERFYSWMFHLVHVEPSNVQECIDWVPIMYDISKEFDLVGFFRVTSRVAHSRQDVRIRQNLPIFEVKEGFFEKNIPKYCSLPPHCVNNHVRLYERMKKFKESKYSKIFNKIIPGDNKLGVITAGVPHGYTMEALRRLDLNDVPVLKYGLINPLDKDIFLKFTENLDKIVIVEELEPFVEVEIKRIAQEEGITIPILGNEIIRKWGELNTFEMSQIFEKLTDKHLGSADILLRYNKHLGEIPPRPPTFCPGCPERALLYALKKATNFEKTIYAGDIGCYVMAFFNPLKITDFIICMSGGLGAAVGASIKSKQDIVALIGDSTLYHTGLPVLVSAIYNKANLLLIVFDNKCTAMTGGHPNPNTGFNAAGELVDFNIAKVVRALGVQNVKTVNPYRPKAMMSAIQSLMKKDGVKVLISNMECGLQRNKYLKKELNELKLENYLISEIIYQVVPERCTNCKECTQILCCTALKIVEDDGKEHVEIDEARCNKCGVCYQICPNSAIVKTVIDPQGIELKGRYEK
ncbi:MAG: thiamine pyrophosphate-dependent enzyme [Candidatus Helarchaeota archaeon]